MTAYMKFIDPLNLMGMGGKQAQAKMPSIPTPDVGDPDKTKGKVSNPALANAASQNVLSNTQTIGSKILGG